MCITTLYINIVLKQFFCRLAASHFRKLLFLQIYIDFLKCCNECWKTDFAFCGILWLCFWLLTSNNNDSRKNVSCLTTCLISYYIWRRFWFSDRWYSVDSKMNIWISLSVIILQGKGCCWQKKCVKMCFISDC